MWAKNEFQLRHTNDSMVHFSSTLSVIFSPLSLSLCISLTRNSSTYQFHWSRTIWNKKSEKRNTSKWKSWTFVLQFFEFICKFPHCLNTWKFNLIHHCFRFQSNLCFAFNVRNAKLYDDDGTYSRTSGFQIVVNVQSRWDCYSVSLTKDFIGKWQPHMHLKHSSWQIKCEGTPV